MSDLLALHGPSYDLNIEMFNRLQHTITGWPGGKPTLTTQIDQNVKILTKKG